MESIARNHGIGIHVYADDVILYSNCNELHKFRLCHENIKEWATQSFLKLNDNKTQLICLSPKTSATAVPSYINLMGEDIKTSLAAKYLGIWFDKNLCFSKQINHICSQGYMTLKNLWKISAKVNDIKLKTQIIHSCLLSKLNFCSILYYCIPKKQTKTLDKLLNAATRFIFTICGTQRRESITPFLQKLHFLPMRYRSEFKTNLITYKCLNDRAPQYLKSLLLLRINDSLVVTRKDSDKTWLNQHSIEKTNYKSRGYQYTAPIA